ncbi:extended synaptotagmin-3 isoform X1 [Diabrotica virgifera virgifera]|uniref:Extended synaptotagmin-2 n=1 Tax=Diabrotica virgifera virgifera TaxID=50390 RepID=A0ABM5J088_DIAVI|nr:extended synaptotagmin-3 isoform X1 [Diabrotica virgifera virgifera]XP_050504055.1 extended synaptotagmin-3 isoform X1 [Diabrotica virgifera virgifera]XP_050504056.1 extended synaptotagmin-3 isoform X1 [Diabrotica virgifera virgifera]
MALSDSNERLDSLFVRIVKRVVFYGLLYLVGYANWSMTWVLIPALLVTLSEEYTHTKKKKRTFAKEAASGKEKEIIENWGELPFWVVFPDVERAEWLNKAVKQCWPFINFYARDLIKTYVENKLKKNLEKYSLKGFHFERIILGSTPLRTGGIVVYDNVSREEIVMDVDVSYAGDCDIKFRLRGLLGGIKNFQMYGKLRIVLKPLIRHFPLIGGVQLFFLNNPDIDFELDGIAGILDVPGINESLRKCVCATVASLMVLPNKFPVKFTPEVSSEQLNTPNPAGVLRVHVIEAKDLVKKDITFTGKSKSDPYAQLVVGEQSFKTETIQSNVNPKWDYWCEFVILESTGQEILITVWDEDATDDEFLGRVSVDIASLIKAELSDMWLVLEDVKHGDIHIRTNWLTLSTDYSNLKAALYESQQLQLSHMSSALLIVYIDSATNLKQVRASTKPDPYVQLQLGRQIKTTNSVMRTVNPVWEESFIFMLTNPDSDYLNLKIFDAKTEAELSEISYNISSICTKDNLEVEKEVLRLEYGKSDRKLIWSLHLKIFHNANFQEYLEKRPSSRASSSSADTIEQVSDSDSVSSDSTKYTSRSSRRHTRLSLRSSSSISSRLSQECYGDINLTMRYSLQRQRLIVVVHRVSNLCFEDPTEDKDIYVKLYLLPERCKATKRKTKVMKGCREPAFDKKLEFLVSQDEINERYLEVSVIEEKVIKNEILGQVIIELKDVSLPLTKSFELGPRVRHD